MKTKKEKIQVPQSRLDELVAEVTGELQTVLKSEAEALAKADGDDDVDDQEPDASAPAEASSGSTAGAPMDSPAPETSSLAAPEASASAAPEASAPGPDAAMAGGDASAPPTLDDLVGAYTQLPPEELDLHLQAATIAKQASASAAGAGAAPAPAAAPPMAPPPEASAPPMMGKAEGIPSATVVAKSPGNGGMRKSEANPEIELLKQQNELLKSENAKFEKSLTELVSALHEKMPLRKSAARISEVEYQGKPGEKKPAAGTDLDVSTLSKSDVTKRLRQAARNPSLSKSDRGLINGYCNGSVKLDAIGHLLASAK